MPPCTTVYYTEVVNIDPAWSPAGLAAARRQDLTLNGVIDIVYAPSSISIAMESTHALWIVGLTGSNTFITVVCDLLARNTTIYEITNVRTASSTEIRAWRSKQ